MYSMHTVPVVTVTGTIGVELARGSVSLLTGAGLLTTESLSNTEKVFTGG